MAFGETMRHLREAAGLTQAGLASKAGLSLRTIQSWEQGRRAPVSPDFFKLAAALGVPCESFADEHIPAPKGKAAAEPPGEKAKRTTSRKQRGQ